MRPVSIPPYNHTKDLTCKTHIIYKNSKIKLVVCYRYQALLQKNLMYLAAIADAQPPTPSPAPTISSQVPFYNSIIVIILYKNRVWICDYESSCTMQMGPLAHAGIPQQGGFFMQHPQAAVMAQQSSSFPQQMPAMQFNSPQVMQPQMGVRPGGPSGPSSVPPSSAASDIWRGGMQDGGGADGSGAGKDGHGAAAGGPDEAK
ncbi:putative transcription factor SSXT family [Helianthus annuus]|nr:putative transcription factor SSXT family [Helianthus annuus]